MNAAINIHIAFIPIINLLLLFFLMFVIHENQTSVDGKYLVDYTSRLKYNEHLSNKMEEECLISRNHTGCVEQNFFGGGYT